MKFSVGREQGLSAADTNVGPFGLGVFVLAGEGWFSSLLARHVKLVRIQLGLPLRFRLFYFLGHNDRLHQRDSSCVRRRTFTKWPWRGVETRAESSAILNVLG